MEVAKRNMWVMKIKYFEFYCKSYYFYERFELKMILSTDDLDILRPCTNQVKGDTEKTMIKLWNRCLKINIKITTTFAPSHMVFYRPVINFVNLRIILFSVRNECSAFRFPPSGAPGRV